MGDIPEVRLDYLSQSIDFKPKIKVSCVWDGGPKIKKWTLFIGSQEGTWDVAILNDCKGKEEMIDLEEVHLSGMRIYAQALAKIDGRARDGKDIEERILSNVASLDIPH